MWLVACQAGDGSLGRRLTTYVEGWHVARLSGLRAVQQRNFGMVRVLRDVFGTALVLAMATETERAAEISSGDRALRPESACSRIAVYRMTRTARAGFVGSFVPHVTRCWRRGPQIMLSAEEPVEL